jgi:ferrous iron transport protein A
MPESRNRLALSEVTAGEGATVLSLDGGRAFSSRLAALGLTPGTRVDMTQNYGRGPLIVTVRGMRVALGRGEAARIIVQRGTDG